MCVLKGWWKQIKANSNTTNLIKHFKKNNVKGCKSSELSRKKLKRKKNRFQHQKGKAGRQKVHKAVQKVITSQSRQEEDGWTAEAKQHKWCFGRERSRKVKAESKFVDFAALADC